MDYNFKDIELGWQSFWAQNKTFQPVLDKTKPKYYVLDMFPYPSGAGLHVGHPLGYIGSDIIARYKRLKGFNVLHPMGYDSFGLPAEQYAIETGRHPDLTTRDNIARYRSQLDQIGFSFDWSREVRTSESGYYKWTQWIFIQLFHSWYNQVTNKAEPIQNLIQTFQKSGNKEVKAASGEIRVFTELEWNAWSEKEQQEILMEYRLAFLADSYVNWCPGLGTVLANEEVKDGFSERGGFPVERKKMRQWFLRITAYADRLLSGLEGIDWSEAIKEQQRNWIGISTGSSLRFQLMGHEECIEVFTTRADTVFGVTFLVLAPEHELVQKITTPAQLEKVHQYVKWAGSRSERDRMSEVKKVTGEFTGAYVIHPFTGDKVPVWIADYVLAGYGTGAVMAVPCGDERDFRFAQVFGLPIKQIMEGYTDQECYPGKEGKLVKSDFLNGLPVKEAMTRIIQEIEKRNLGKGKKEYRIRDAGFSRQRYWGEPIPVYYKDEMPYTLDEKELPLLLPEVDKYLPTETGEPPLGRAKNWKKGEYPLETNTMPGWAGSSWYFIRYEDPHNEKEFASREAIDYWNQIDLYVGGSEHATGHLLYVRFWTKFLKDLGRIGFEEPAKKLVNQGMIQGRSSFVYRLNHTQVFISYEFYKAFQEKEEFLEGDMENLLRRGLGQERAKELMQSIRDAKEKEENQSNLYGMQAIHVDVNIVDNDILDEARFRKFRSDFEKAEFIREADGKYHCGSEVEKMSKSKYNVVNPDQVIEQFGADTFRMYEMFLGPLEMAKPWNTHGIEGVYRFLKKFWKLFHDQNFNFMVKEEKASPEALKILHKTIKKIEEDLEKLSFNTSVSQFMICVNELSQVPYQNREILEPLVILLSPFAPHISEELWSLLGHPKGSLSFAKFPSFNPEYLVESEFNYPISLNGKVKMNHTLSLDLDNETIEKIIRELPEFQKYLNGQVPKKIIVVKGRIINVVV